MTRLLEITSLLLLLGGLSSACNGDPNDQNHSAEAFLNSDATVTLDAAASSDAAIATTGLNGDGALLTQLDASARQADAQLALPEHPDAGDAGAGIGGWCFGPGINLDRAYEPTAKGCACTPDSTPRCERDTKGRGIGLVCEHNSWMAVEDGPCSPAPSP